MNNLTSHVNNQEKKVIVTSWLNMVLALYVRLWEYGISYANFGISSAN
jgi:hypothetical protein